MADGDILLVESVAHEMMSCLGYDTYLVGKSHEPLVFVEDQITEFNALNLEGIKKMKETLAVENVEEANRRGAQRALLESQAIMLSSRSLHEESDVDQDEEDEANDEDKMKVKPYWYEC